jgi:hypothetical protein
MMGPTELVMALLSLLFALGGVGILIYIVSLFRRLVRAVEKIAEKK